MVNCREDAVAPRDLEGEPVPSWAGHQKSSTYRLPNGNPGIFGTNAFQAEWWELVARALACRPAECGIGIFEWDCRAEAM